VIAEIRHETIQRLEGQERGRQAAPFDAEG
jgi:hypothetical protein